jgi:hypothetical protein
VLFGTGGQVRTKFFDVAVAERCRIEMTCPSEGQNILPVDIRVAPQLR